MRSRTFAILALISLPLNPVFASGKVDKAATLTARNCPAITQIALSRDVKIDAQPILTYVVDVWLSGEFILDLRVVLSENSGLVRVDVIQAKKKAICVQLKKLYSSSPSLTPDEAAQLISLKAMMYSEAKFPHLRTLFEEARVLRLNTNLSNSIFFPSRGVTLRVTNGIEEAVVTFVQPEPSADGVAFSGKPTVSQPQAAEWVEKLLGILKLSKK